MGYLPVFLIDEVWDLAGRQALALDAVVLLLGLVTLLYIYVEIARRISDSGVAFARAEGIVPAPEANHAVKGAIAEALRCKEDGVSRAILFNLCGHGHFDMQAYTDYFAGRLDDQPYDEGELAMALAGLPSVA